jgi:hypothetical protein
MNYSATGDYQNHYNAEITNVVIPDVKRLQNAGYDFKFRIVDIAQLCIDVFEEYGKDFEYNINFHFSPNNPSRSIFRRKIDDYKNIIAEGKKLCFVWGKEKPTLLMEDGKSYFCFTDNVDDCVSPYIQRNYYQGWYDEFFYWTPDFPMIPIKQAHVVNNFIKHCNNEDMFEPLFRGIFQSNGISKKFRKHLKVEHLKTIIYPKWSNDIFCNGKTPSYTYSLRDEWFFRSNLELKQKFIHITNDYFKVANPDNPRNRKSVLPRYSPKYRIE